MTDAKRALVLLTALLGAGVAACGAARGGEGPDASLPEPAEIIRVMKDGTYHEVATLAIDIIERYKKSYLAESVAAIRGFVGLYKDAELPQKRREIALELIARTGGVEAANFLVTELGTGKEDTVLPAARAAAKLLARHKIARDKGLPDTWEAQAAAEAMRNLGEQLVRLVEEGEGPVREAAVKALSASDLPEAVQTLIGIMREEPALAKSAGKALQGISGKKMPADPGAWESWQHHAATSPVARETERDRSVRVMGPPRGEGAMFRALPPGRGSGRYYLYALAAAGVVGVLLLVRSSRQKKAAAKLEAGRRKIRRGGF